MCVSVRSQSKQDEINSLIRKRLDRGNSRVECKHSRAKDHHKHLQSGSLLRGKADKALPLLASLFRLPLTCLKTTGCWIKPYSHMAHCDMANLANKTKQSTVFYKQTLTVTTTSDAKLNVVPHHARQCTRMGSGRRGMRTGGQQIVCRY